MGPWPWAPIDSLHNRCRVPEGLIEKLSHPSRRESLQHMAHWAVASSMFPYTNIGFYIETYRIYYTFSIFVDTIWQIVSIFAYILVYSSDFCHFPDACEAIYGRPGKGMQESVGSIVLSFRCCESLFMRTWWSCHGRAAQR